MNMKSARGNSQKDKDRNNYDEDTIFRHSRGGAKRELTISSLREVARGMRLSALGIGFSK